MTTRTIKVKISKRVCKKLNIESYAHPYHYKRGKIRPDARQSIVSYNNWYHDD